MKASSVIKGFLVSLAVVGFCLPQAALAANGPSAKAPSTKAPQLIDVALSDGGLLLGQVVSAQGTAVKKAPVVLKHQGREIAKAQSNEQGYFAVRGLGGGIYQVKSAEGQGLYRLWAPGQAPPAAQKGVLVVAGRDLVRAQGPVLGHLGMALGSPLIIAGVVAASIAVPVAVHNSERPRSP